MPLFGTPALAAAINDPRKLVKDGWRLGSCSCSCSLLGKLLKSALLCSFGAVGNQTTVKVLALLVENANLGLLWGLLRCWGQFDVGRWLWGRRAHGRRWLSGFWLGLRLRLGFWLYDGRRFFRLLRRLRWAIIKPI